MSTDVERIAQLEVKVEAMQGDLHDIKASQDQMLRELQRYRGFVGGIMLTLGAVWAFVQLVIPMVTGWFQTKN